jgi:hypothetical protein
MAKEFNCEKLRENLPIACDKKTTNEVQNIMALHHQNVLKLVGYCHEGQKKVVLNNGRYIVADIVESLICYEYSPQGSLGKIFWYVILSRLLYNYYLWYII